MKKGDSALVYSAFAKEVTMATIYRDKNNLPAIKNELGIEDFLKAVGTPHNELWNEPIWDLKIKIDGNLAQALASYAFYRGNTFSHCSEDAFHLFKSADGQWRIFHLADTRQTEGCVIPPEIKVQFK